MMAYIWIYLSSEQKTLSVTWENRETRKGGDLEM